MAGVTAVKRIPYFAEDGTQAAVRFRLALGGEDRFRWKSGTKPCLYGLWRLQDARRVGYLVMVEGESDCQTLWHVAVPAVGLPGANLWWEEWAQLLVDIPTIYVVIEPDKGGESVRQWLGTSCIRDRAHLLRLGEHKDRRALYLADPEHFKERWQAALGLAIPWTVQAEDKRRQQASSAYELAKEFLEASDLLERIGTAMQQRGYGGDVRPPKLAYVGVTSRLLERPQNLAFVAPSATGKNRAVDEALSLIPSEAVYLMKAGPPRGIGNLLLISARRGCRVGQCPHFEANLSP